MDSALEIDVEVLDIDCDGGNARLVEVSDDVVEEVSAGRPEVPETDEPLTGRDDVLDMSMLLAADVESNDTVLATKELADVDDTR